MNQSQIDRELSKIKRWYAENYPLCGFCGHLVCEGDLAHFIRRSESRELQTVKLNCCLAHRSCHDIYDNDIKGSLYLPRISEVLYVTYLLEERYFHRIADNYPDLSHVLQLFPSVPYQNITHHGEVISLQYLIH